MHNTNEPTSQTYGEFNKAYDFFNTKLFNGQLPKCLITLQRKARAYGYFCADRFDNLSKEAVTDEIALNPSHFRQRGPRMVFSTLVHEMVHLWQQHFGKPSRGGYHNLEWAHHMELVGLMPSTTGEKGGKRTGQKVTHYIIEGGPYDLACKELLASGLTITWADSNEEKRRSKAVTRAKYTCSMCGLNMWGKPKAAIQCITCDEIMIEN